MRIIVDGSPELIATDEGITNAEELPLAARSSAQHINLAFNELTSLRGLESAKLLRSLNISDNALHSLLGVDSFVHLRRLRCSNNRISDLTSLQALPHLEELWINNNQVEGAQITHLSSITALETLVLHPNPCTNDVNYVLHVVKQVPWIKRLDLTVVDDSLRERSLHLDDRTFLSSAASNTSEISLMTARSNEEQIEFNPTESLSQATAPAQKSAPAEESVNTSKNKPKKQKMTAEDFMRGFPVQDFIPPTESAATSTTTGTATYSLHRLNTSDVKQADVPTLLSTGQEAPVPERNEECYSNQADVTSVIEVETATMKHSSSASHIVPARSSILSAVMDLPFMATDGSNKKKTLMEKSIEKPKQVKKTASVKANTTPSADPALATFNQQELLIPYPNSTVNAVQIRGDGSALAKWPSGNVAVSVDRERDGFRCYAAHKDGTIALSLDASGVGFINYYPSGRMMISTSAGGDGLYFSNDGFTILRQWNTERINDDKGMPVSHLSDTETDGSLVVKLSDGLGVQVQLSRDKDARPSMIQLKIFFSSGTGLRHAFSNWINRSEPTGAECDAVFGQAPKQLKKAKTAPKASHSDTLHSIRAAVAGL